MASHHHHHHHRRVVLIPTTGERDAYAGFFLSSRGDSYRLALRCEAGGGQVDQRSVRVDPALQQVMRPFLRSLAARGRHAADLHAFTAELVDLADQAIEASLPAEDHFLPPGSSSSSSSSSSSVVPAAFYELLLEELQRLGWQRLVAVDAQRRVITLCSTDGAGRPHELTLTLPPDYPHSAPRCATDLPRPFHPSPRRRQTAGNHQSRQGVQHHRPHKRGRRDASGSAAAGGGGGAGGGGLGGDGSGWHAAFSLLSIVEQWEAELAAYQALWSQLDDLDDHTWILEPERVPAKRATMAAMSSASTASLTSDTAAAAAGASTAKKRASSSTTSPSSTSSSSSSSAGAAAGAGAGAGAAAAAVVPARPPRHATHRRVAVAPHASVLIAELDPSAPYAAPPNVRFLGKESIVAPLRARFSRSVQRAWDASGRTSLRHNLESVLGVALPCPAKSKSGGDGDDDRYGFTAACAICYTYRLNAATTANGQGSSASSSASSGDASSGSTANSSGSSTSNNNAIPEVVCSNARCSRSFHSSCLSEWLRGLPNASRSFETLFGHCPYCFEAISVKVQPSR